MPPPTCVTWSPLPDLTCKMRIIFPYVVLRIKCNVCSWRGPTPATQQVLPKCGCCPLYLEFVSFRLKPPLPQTSHPLRTRPPPPRNCLQLCQGTCLPGVTASGRYWFYGSQYPCRDAGAQLFPPPTPIQSMHRFSAVGSLHVCPGFPSPLVKGEEKNLSNHHAPT